MESVMKIKILVNHLPITYLFLGQKWVLITTAFHMTRAMNIAEKLNWPFIPYAVDFYTYKKFTWKPSVYFLNNIYTTQSAIHEWIGLLAYYFTGKTNKIY